MAPTLFVHGYSAENEGTDYNSVARIYGSIIGDLREKVPGPVIDIDLSRWISLNDALSLNDISRGFDRALHQSYPQLLTGGFNVVTHSTGALVVRNWIRLFSPRPSPVQNLVHLAGANFGSGWASIGQGQLAKWGRFVFESGAQRGVKILQSLELGSSPTIDLHTFFLAAGNRMLDDFGVQEYVIIGTHADAAWFEFPIPYAKEDGSDGVVRVSAGNLNFSYFKIVPDVDPLTLGWPRVQSLADAASRRGSFPPMYRVDQTVRPFYDYPEIPLAIVLNCAHTGAEFGVVAGSQPREKVLELLAAALNTPAGNAGAWRAQVAAFHQATEATYTAARNLPKTGLFNSVDQRHQYDAHAQVIFRIRDEDGEPITVDESDIYFDSRRNSSEQILVGDLIERTAVSDYSDHCIVFYLRVTRFDDGSNDWEYRLARVANFALEITAIDPRASRANPIVQYLPLRLDFTPDQLAQVVRPHATTVIDVQMVRIPAPESFLITPVP